MTTRYGPSDIESFFRTINAEISERAEEIVADQGLLDSMRVTLYLREFYESYAVFVSILDHMERHRERKTEISDCHMLRIFISMSKMIDTVLEGYGGEDEDGQAIADAADAFLKMRRREEGDHGHSDS